MMERHVIREIIDQAKDIANTTGFIELSEQLEQVYSEHVSLEDKLAKTKHAYKEFQNRMPSNRKQKASIETKIKTTGPPEECYENEEDGVLFCPTCWENNKVLVKLIITPPQTKSIGKYRCSRCNKCFGNR